MATSPNFTKTPRAASVLTVTGSPVTTLTGVHLDGTPTAGVTLLISGVATVGTKITSITAKATATTSNPILCNIWISYNAGTNCFVYDQLIVPAATMTTAVPASRIVATYSDLVLPDDSAKLYVASTTADVLHVTALGGNLDA